MSASKALRHRSISGADPLQTMVGAQELGNKRDHVNIEQGKLRKAQEEIDVRTTIDKLKKEAEQLDTKTSEMRTQRRLITSH